MIKIGCLHAHYSNIEYIEETLTALEAELVHFVDPGLIYHINWKPKYELAIKVKEQLNWILSCQVDAIFITCTNYIALLDEIPFQTNIPVIKIDEPFFEQICKHDHEQLLLFTNPATVSGTMARLHQYADKKKKTINVEVSVIENSFELIMSGRKDAYNQVIMDYLDTCDNDTIISVAQLSMVEAARLSKKEIGHPLDSLEKHIVRQIAKQV
ncbi:hypothetical protein F9U64_07085 [Gracilibacillus oryzae]|uniref:Asp/Glu/hydantoin racemase n=1 Tax=Gracilibacillus oryzae TaxID=1672701 RepID=A0A7C8L0D0_9BACI|nr:hypothetical protein [Gracilibacillus oryzae]KAB8137973.1 hypothetical protein F9U64_07085 [Gracilibacillus oryzae]